MAVDIVDVFEVVKINRNHSHTAVALTTRFQKFSESAHVVASVKQPCQRIQISESVGMSNKLKDDERQEYLARKSERVPNHPVIGRCAREEEIRCV